MRTAACNTQGSCKSAQLRRKSFVVDVYPETRDDRRSFELREYPGAFLGMDQQVVGPAQVASKIRYLQNRLGSGQSQRQGHQGQLARSKTVAQNDRDVQAQARW